MHVAICATQTPFVAGGAELHVNRLLQACLDRNIRASLIRLPFSWQPPMELIRSAMAWRFLDLQQYDGEEVDVVVATKFPTWVVRSTNTVCWLLHQHRSAYDLSDTEYDDLGVHVDGEHVKTLIRHLDVTYLSKCSKLFANSRNVADRLRAYTGLRAPALYHPPPHEGRYRCSDYGDTVIYPSRVNVLKRQELAIRAMAQTTSPVRLAIVGAGPDLPGLQQLAADLNVTHKVSFTGYVSDEELLELYGSCLGVLYLPVDEDYGYVTLEAFLSQKPVITVSDAGGPLEFVTHEENGLVAQPEPAAVAAALDTLHRSGSAPDLGRAGLATYEDKNISWDAVMDALFGSDWRKGAAAP